ncbi:hypothetical protein [Terasakiella pusilla]|uniref:hypothetical protein n=1 Tax=Terasakiella pusilla TaxID=64973 RepID=UPI003AA8AF15
MSKHIENLLAEIDLYCERKGIKPTTFGIHAMNDGKFVSRLRKGGSVRVETLDRVKEFMSQDSQPA